MRIGAIAEETANSFKAMSSVCCLWKNEDNDVAELLQHQTKWRDVLKIVVTSL